jgi:hypothetical protein
MVRYIADDLATLRTAAAASPVFSGPDFCDIRWAGVFGPFARGTQNEYSEVDVVVIEIPPSDLQGQQPLLEDERTP